jgi:hypothetical protein
MFRKVKIFSKKKKKGKEAKPKEKEKTAPPPKAKPKPIEMPKLKKILTAEGWRRRKITEIQGK